MNNRAATIRRRTAAEQRAKEATRVGSVLVRVRRSYAAYALYAIVVVTGSGLFLVTLFVVLIAVLSDIRAVLAIVALLLALKGLHMLNGGSWVGLFDMRKED